MLEHIIWGRAEFTFAGCGSSSLSQEQIISYLLEVRPVCIGNQILIVSP